MFKFKATIMYIKTEYPGKYVDGVLVKNKEGAFLYINLNSKSEYYELVKSGKWMDVEICLRLRTKVIQNGTTKYMNIIHIDKVLEVFDEYLEEVEGEKGEIVNESI